MKQSYAFNSVVGHEKKMMHIFFSSHVFYVVARRRGTFGTHDVRGSRVTKKREKILCVFFRLWQTFCRLNTLVFPIKFMTGR